MSVNKHSRLFRIFIIALAYVFVGVLLFWLVASIFSHSVREVVPTEEGEIVRTYVVYEGVPVYVWVPMVSVWGGLLILTIVLNEVFLAHKKKKNLEAPDGSGDQG